MTEREFLAAHASKCPNCGSDNIQDDEYTWAGRHFVIDQFCLSCESDWQVTMTIDGYCNLETPEN